MSWLKEVFLTALVGLSPVWAALVIGAICWAARYFGGGDGADEQCSSLREKK